MTNYRAYQLDEFGHIAGPPEILTCDDDQAAIERAKLLVNGRDIEVWDLDRLVIMLFSRDQWPLPTSDTATSV